MEITLIVLSFFIHFIVLIAIYSLYKQVQQKNENTADIMNIFENYLQEVKDENERLQNELLKSTPQKNNIKPFKNYPTPPVDERNVKITEIVKDNDEYVAPVDDQSPDYDLSLQAQILQLHDKGYTEENIARKLDCGKTEVELVIKLYNKKTT